MTRQKTLQCVHEPFGDAYYFGPERLAERYEEDSEARKQSGYSESTYRTIFDRIAKENSEVSNSIPSFGTKTILFETPRLRILWSLSYLAFIPSSSPHIDAGLWPCYVNT